MFAGDGVRLGVGNADVDHRLATVLIYWLGNLFYNIEGLQAMVMPARRSCALLRGASPPVHAAQHRAVAFKCIC